MRRARARADGFSHEAHQEHKGHQGKNTKPKLVVFFFVFLVPLVPLMFQAVGALSVDQTTAADLNNARMDSSAPLSSARSLAKQNRR